MSAALEQYSALLQSPRSVNYGDVQQRQAKIEADQAKHQDNNTPTLTEIQEADQSIEDAAAPCYSTENPNYREKLPRNAFTGESDSPATVVHKSVRTQIREVLGLEDAE